jgi:ubiquinol-cytochrome c reductase cytochrome b subunit
MRTDRRGAAEKRPTVSHNLADSVLGRWSVAAIAHAKTRPVSFHWITLFGVVSAACATTFVATGVVLMFAFDPSSAQVQYLGSYLPLKGTTVSAAYASVLHIVFDVPGGMLLRQLHHWSMQLLPAAILMQMLAVFFTGGFRKPRRTNWVLLFMLFVVALIGGWSGYGLADDMLSGTGLRIVEGIMLGIPVVGAWASSSLFGGAFPGVVIERLAVVHFLIVPALLVAIFTVRGLFARVQRPAQIPGPGRTEQSLTGVPLLPTGFVRLGGLFAATAAILVLLAATVTVSPVWTYGPSDPASASAGSQPDWYTGFLDGALRLVPSHWEFVLGGYTVTAYVLIPLGVVTLFFLAVLAYPFIEQWVSNDDQDHNLLQRPRDTPTRTGIGVAGLTFAGTLWAAGSADVVAHQLGFSFEHLVLAGQLTLLVGPIAAFSAARRASLALQKKDREILSHGYETGRLVRIPGGEVIDVHEPADAATRWRILARENHAPLPLRPQEDGRIPIASRLRVQLSKAFYEDRLAPLPPSELREAQSQKQLPRGEVLEPARH